MSNLKILGWMVWPWLRLKVLRWTMWPRDLTQSFHHIGRHFDFFQIFKNDNSPKKIENLKKQFLAAHKKSAMFVWNRLNLAGANHPRTLTYLFNELNFMNSYRDGKSRGNRYLTLYPFPGKWHRGPGKNSYTTKLMLISQT